MVDQNTVEDYEEMFNPLRQDRQARRKRKPDVNPNDRALARAARAREMAADLDGLEGGFTPSYRPSRHEATWLLGSLREFYQQSLITDVLARVRGGKEAAVYRCAGHTSTGHEFLAAKVYRPDQFRSLSNDAAYTEGRSLLTADAHQVKKNQNRVARAVGKKTAFGRQVAHTSWLMHEFTVLQRLHASGAAVPRPFAADDNAILMAFIGDADRAAPALNEVALAEEELAPLFDEILRNIRLLLGFGWTHGDLSAYNILYQEGAITLIDFPQVVAVTVNSQARTLLNRDVERVCEYFATQGLERDPEHILTELWASFKPRTEAEEAADLSRLAEEWRMAEEERRAKLEEEER
jgi:RIO kinase 1